MARKKPDYKFTLNAERDLENIIDHTLQNWSIEQTNAYLDGLESQAQLLAENPGLGKIRQELTEGLLSFPYESHILYYKKHASDIVILRVLHQHMDPSNHL
jgi:toxin ParE1/3/4